MADRRHVDQQDAMISRLLRENERLRAIARDSRDHVPPDVLARIDAALHHEQKVPQKP